MFTGASEPDGRAAVVIIDADCGICARTVCPWNSPDDLAHRESVSCIRDGGVRLQRHRTQVSVAEHSIGLRVEFFWERGASGVGSFAHDDRVCKRVESAACSKHEHDTASCAYTVCSWEI